MNNISRAEVSTIEVRKTLKKRITNSRASLIYLERLVTRRKLPRHQSQKLSGSEQLKDPPCLLIVPALDPNNWRTHHVFSSSLLPCFRFLTTQFSSPLLFCFGTEEAKGMEWNEMKWKGQKCRSSFFFVRKSPFLPSVPCEKVHLSSLRSTERQSQPNLGSPLTMRDLKIGCWSLCMVNGGT